MVSLTDHLHLVNSSHTLCQLGPPNNLTLSMVLLPLLLLIMMGIVTLVVTLLLLRFLGMDSRQRLVMLLRLAVMVSTLRHNLDTVNKQQQTLEVMVTKGRLWIRVMVVVQGWGMVHLFSLLLILNQHQLWLRLQLQLQLSLAMISLFLKLKQLVDMQPHSHSLSLSHSHKQVMVSMIVV